MTDENLCADAIANVCGYSSCPLRHSIQVHLGCWQHFWGWKSEVWQENVVAKFVPALSGRKKEGKQRGSNCSNGLTLLAMPASYWRMKDNAVSALLLRPNSRTPDKGKAEANTDNIVTWNGDTQYSIILGDTHFTIRDEKTKEDKHFVFRVVEHCACRMSRGIPRFPTFKVQHQT